MHPPAPSSIHLHPAHFNLHLAPSVSSTSFQSPPSSLQHTQSYWNQNIALNWETFPNLGRKIQSWPFGLKISPHGNLKVQIPIYIFEIPTPKSIFGQIWAEKVKVIGFS